MTTSRPIVYFFSDFGPNGPYTGQVEAVIRDRTSAQFINLISDAPAADPYHSAYLLAALFEELPVKKGYMLAVVDPGVGSDRQVITFQIGKMTFLGPDNGLFSRLIHRHDVKKVAVLEHPVSNISKSFHARDWFAPELARMINGGSIGFQFQDSENLTGYDWPDQVGEIVYIDHYGNLVTGLNAKDVNVTFKAKIKESELSHAQTFSEVTKSELFWYQNSMGMIEIAANADSAADLLNAKLGDSVMMV